MKCSDASASPSVWTLTSARSVSRKHAGRLSQRDNAREAHKRLREEANAKHRSQDPDSIQETKMRRYTRLVHVLTYGSTHVRTSTHIHHTQVTPKPDGDREQCLCSSSKVAGDENDDRVGYENGR